MNKVCVYAIFKNEEKNMKEWLDCVRDADCILLLDNGSSDDSSNIILKYKEEHQLKNLYKIDLTESVYDVGYGYLRNAALTAAKTLIEKTSDNWVMLSLDLDEFLEPNGINKIRNIWNKDYDMMYMRGITRDGDCNGNYQDVYHKCHNIKDITWIRFVHEITVKIDIPMNEWNINYPKDIVSYEHRQDKSKVRDYYKLLKKEHEFLPKDITNNMYLSWEAINHGEIEKYFKYSNDALNYLLTNKDDPYYQNIEYIIQCHFNIANYYLIKEDFENASIHYDIIQSEYINTGKFSKIKRLYFEAGSLYTRIYNSTHDISCIRKAIELFNEELTVKERPFCFVDNDDLYITNNYVYYNLSTLYFELGKSKLISINERRTYLEKSVEYIILILNGDSDILKGEAKMIAEERANELKEFSKKHGVTPNKNKIAVYAICHNEEQFVERWYNSMKEADYVVVLDTGSTDNTVQKLRELGAIVDVKTYNPWRFDTPRNDAMAMVPEDANILISTDLDEVLEPGWADILRERWIDGVHERAVYKYSWSHLQNGESGRVFHYNKIHTRNWIWKYPVHELLWDVNTKSEHYPDYKSLYLFNDIHLHHYPDQTKSRGSYLPLLELRAEENKDDYYGLIYLSHEYFYRGFYDKSITVLNRVLKEFSNEANSVEKASCYLFMGDDYVNLNDNDKAIESYLKSIEEDPTYREGYLNLAKVYISLNDYESAIRYIKESIEKSVRHYSWLERDTSWTYEPFDLLTLACYYSGRKAESISYAAKALSFDTENERLKENLKLCIKNTNDFEMIKQI